MKLSAPIYRLKRDARRLAKAAGVSLSAQLDRMARAEGFASWGQLSQSWSESHPAARLLSRLELGQMILLAARAGHGKTVLGLDLCIEALHAGAPAHFFTLAYSDLEVAQRLAEMPEDRAEIGQGIQLDWSDGISADHIAASLAEAPRGAVVVIDYLQLLDQRRDIPALQDQVATLAGLAKQRGLIMVLISQVDRAVDHRQDQMPGLSDIRLPNPLDLTLFDQACFLHNGEITLRPVEFAGA